jgi:hypothetical protein
MLTTAIATEVTGAVEGLRSGLETQGRALGVTVRDLVASTIGTRDADRSPTDPVIVERTLTRC